MSPALRDGLEEVVQSYDYGRGPSVTKESPQSIEERAYTIMLLGMIGDPVNRIRGVPCGDTEIQPFVPEQFNRTLNELVWPLFSRLDAPVHEVTGFTTMRGGEKSCIDNVPSERHVCTERPMVSQDRVCRTRKSFAWDLNPWLDPDATVSCI